MRSIMFLLTVTLVAFATANEHFCPEKVLGKPANECGLYGLGVLGKDDRDQRTATRNAELALVKAGTCYTLFPDVDVGDTLFTMDGKQISHVTYCGAAKLPEPTPEDAPEPEVPATPATCELVAQTQRTCKRIAQAKEHCTSCVTSACRACRDVFVKHCEHPTPVESVEACLAARGGPCRKQKGTKVTRCLSGLRRQCESHVCDVQPPTPEEAPEPITPAVPAVCQLTARDAKTCRKLAAAKEHCTSCVTSSCIACRKVFEKFCQKPTPVASVDSCLAARGGPCMKKQGTSRDRCLNGLRRQCEEHQCTKQPEPEPEVPVPEPEVPVPQPEVPVPQPPVVVPQPPKVTPPAAPCVPRTKRRLKIRGEGKSCKDAPKIRRKVKELKQKVNCLLQALSGEIPKEKIVVSKPPPKVIHEKIKVVKPGKWVKQPDEVIVKDVTRIINARTVKPKKPKKPVVKKPVVKKPVVKKPVVKKPVKKVVKKVKKVVNKRVVRPANARQVDMAALKALAAKKLAAARRNKRVTRRRRRRRRGGRAVVRRRRRRPANGRVVRRRRRRRRGGRAVRRRRRRRRGGRAVVRRRRRPANGRVVRRRRRRRRGGRAVVRRRRPANARPVRPQPVRPRNGRA